MAAPVTHSLTAAAMQNLYGVVSLMIAPVEAELISLKRYFPAQAMTGMFLRSSDCTPHNVIFQVLTFAPTSV